MENKKKKKTGLLLSILGVVSLVLITAGVTYAFFSYAKEGKTVNRITTGTIEFTYNEIDNNSNGISISNALPMEDADGMVLGGDTQSHETLANNRNVFLFTITSKTPTNANIPYIVTARKQAGSDLSEGQIKLYLTASQNDGTNNTVVSSAVQTFAQLRTSKPLSGNSTVFAAYNTANPSNTWTANADEVVLYEGTVPAAQANEYKNSFVLRMWLNGNANEGSVDYSPYEFVKKTSVAAANGQALNARTLIAANTAQNKVILKSTEYYALSESTCTVGGNAVEADSQATCEALDPAGTWTPGARDDYERIAYVNGDNIITVSQTGVDHTSYTASEQFYELSGQSFSVKVNVYANAAVYTAPAQP